MEKAGEDGSLRWKGPFDRVDVVRMLYIYPLYPSLMGHELTSFSPQCLSFLVKTREDIGYPSVTGSIDKIDQLVDPEDSPCVIHARLLAVF